MKNELKFRPMKRGARNFLCSKIFRKVYGTSAKRGFVIIFVIPWVRYATSGRLLKLHNPFVSTVQIWGIKGQSLLQNIEKINPNHILNKRSLTRLLLYGSKLCLATPTPIVCKGCSHIFKGYVLYILVF